jgi:hypothetical protein
MCRHVVLHVLQKKPLAYQKTTRSPDLAVFVALTPARAAWAATETLASLICSLFSPLLVAMEERKDLRGPPLPSPHLPSARGDG